MAIHKHWDYNSEIVIVPPQEEKESSKMNLPEPTEQEIICGRIEINRPHVELIDIEQVRSGQETKVIRRPFNQTLGEDEVRLVGGKVLVRNLSVDPENFFS
jgi:hypothetical protein